MPELDDSLILKSSFIKLIREIHLPKSLKGSTDIAAQIIR